ncbi:MAG: ferredoxin family protein [Polyangiaceae bacterium]|nr:ferredoxin family protein [Polyangiaceae bacterium]
MTGVITQDCVGTCDTACVDVCPTLCIHGPIDLEELRELEPESPRRLSVQLYIDPEECIDCAACLPECPVNAIYRDDEVPEESKGDITANAQFFVQLRGAR